MVKEKKIIGRAEVVDLPELGLYNVPAKIDTGAETSVVHCEDMQVLEEGGHMYILAHIAASDDSDETLEIRFPVHRERTVKSSFGQAETRHIFRTKIKIFNELYDIKLSFRDRSAMTYPMLLGRNFIAGKFLVDVSKRDLGQNLR
ncbi:MULTISPECIES: ATP-dependent zinc protease family protein [Sphingobacterium]|uniref:ATP-dependent zinc protease n=1 Tax=Sphingobacterium populi TaxID=1812824 RepID=A0ABW5UFI7_9SPHI|nr:RimK/LysX family protein [Sphingobacterium sp. CFCC 11742]